MRVLWIVLHKRIVAVNLGSTSVADLGCGCDGTVSAAVLHIYLAFRSMEDLRWSVVVWMSTSVVIR